MAILNMGIIFNLMEYEDLKFRPKNFHGHNGIFFHVCIIFTKGDITM